METIKMTDEQYGLLFDVRRSVRYHDKRKSFYELCHLATSLFTIAVSGIAFGDLMNSSGGGLLVKWIAGIAALLASLDMLLGYARRMQLHQTLKLRFTDLEIKLLDRLDENDLREAQKERLLIENEEPPVYVALDAICRNELLSAYGFPMNDAQDGMPRFIKLTYLQRLTSQFVRWAGTDFARQVVACLD